MPALAPRAERLRRALRRPGDALPRASIGTVPILWNNVDQPHLAAPVDATTVVDDIARTGYEGTQLGTGFPGGGELKAMLVERGLRLAEVYASLPCTAEGPAEHALEVGRERLELLHDGGGDVLVLALDGSADRSAAAGRAADPSTPRLDDDAWRRLGGIVDRIASEAIAAGHTAAFQPHAGAFLENPAELVALLSVTHPGRFGVALDVGHPTRGRGGSRLRARPLR